MYKTKELNNGVYEEDFNEILKMNPGEIIEKLGTMSKATYFYLYKKENTVILFYKYFSREYGTDVSSVKSLLSTNQMTLYQKGFTREDNDEINDLVDNNHYQELFDFLQNYNNNVFDIVLIENEDEGSEEPLPLT